MNFEKFIDQIKSIEKIFITNPIRILVWEIIFIVFDGGSYPTNRDFY